MKGPSGFGSETEESRGQFHESKVKSRIPLGGTPQNFNEAVSDVNTLLDGILIPDKKCLIVFKQNCFE